MAKLATAERAYQLFDTWIERFVLQNRSILTLDSPVCFLPEALQEAIARFIGDYRTGSDSFQDKLGSQLEGASEEARHILAHAHWLWSLSICDITVSTKIYQISEILGRQDLCTEFFTEGFQTGGPYHKTNKHAEISTILRIFELLLDLKSQQQLTSLETVKAWIEQACLFGRHRVLSQDYALSEEIQKKFLTNAMAIYSILLHLVKPDGYEPIVSDGQKKAISTAFKLLVTTPTAHVDQQILEIRKRLERLPRLENFNWSEDEEILPVWTEQNSEKRNQLYTELGIQIVPATFSDAQCVQLVQELRAGERTAWYIKPGEKGKVWEECLRDKNIRFGWDGTMERYFASPPSDELGLIELMREFDEGYQEKSPKKAAKIILGFVREMKAGDVLIAADGRDKLIGLGLVTGEALRELRYSAYKTTRSVDWLLNVAANPVLMDELKQRTKILPIDTMLKIDSSEEAIEIIKLMQARQKGRTDMPPVNLVKHPLNQILYGPPGTGKTWQMIQYALGILEGKPLASLTQEPRPELMKRFKAYQQAGQIGFVTFHSSYAYEDFVQGLRPVLQTQGQLAFELKDGIFKELADEARRNFLASQSHHSGKPDFESVFESLMRPMLEGEQEEIEIPMKTAGGFFSVEEITNSTVRIRNQKGGKYGLSRNVLERLYITEPVVWKTNGLYAYLRQFTDQMHRHAQQMQENQPHTESIPPKNYVLIIDEINRASLSRVFGELMTLLEPDKRLGAENEIRMTLPSGDTFSLPPNLFLLGTMNTADKSIALVDIALRRRFHFVPVYPDAGLIEQTAWRIPFMRLNEFIRERKGADFQIGHAYFLNETSLESILNHKVIPLLLEYFLNDLRTVKGLLSEAGWKTEETVWGGLQYLNV